MVRGVTMSYGQVFAAMIIVIVALAIGIMA
jgi:hypothetical protein